MGRLHHSFVNEACHTCGSSCVSHRMLCLQLRCHGKLNLMHARTVFWMCSSIFPGSMSHVAAYSRTLKRCSTDKQLICRVYDERCSHTKRLIEEIWKCLNICLTQIKPLHSIPLSQCSVYIFWLDLCSLPWKWGYGSFVTCSCVNLSSTIIPSTVT